MPCVKYRRGYRAPALLLLLSKLEVSFYSPAAAEWACQHGLLVSMSQGSHATLLPCFLVPAPASRTPASPSLPARTSLPRGPLPSVAQHTDSADIADGDSKARACSAEAGAQQSYRQAPSAPQPDPNPTL